MPHHEDDAAASAPRRGPGRPRSPAADEAILTAAFELFAECGYADLSMEAVASRAGVAKTTLYRRYPDKASLIAAASDRARPPIDFPDTGSLRTDIEAVVHASEQGAAQMMGLRLFALMLEAFAEHSELREVYWRNFVEPRRRAFGGILERAKQRGELGEDVEVDLLIDVLAGSIFYLLLNEGPEPLTARVGRILDLLLAGAQPPAQPPS